MNLFSVPSAVARAIGSLCLTKATLAINAGSAATFKSTGTITYLIDGVFKTKAALSAQAFSSGLFTVKSGYRCLFAVALDASGNVKTFQGPLYKTETVDGATKYRPYRILQNNTPGSSSVIEPIGTLVDSNCRLFPEVPGGYSVIGAIKVNAASADFVPGATALDAAGVTTTYTDLAFGPASTDI